MCLHEKIFGLQNFGVVQIFVDLIFDLQSGIENKILAVENNWLYGSFHIR